MGEPADSAGSRSPADGARGALRDVSDQRSPTWERLEDQVRWHSARSRTARQRYHLLKVVELVVAALLPVVAGVGAPVIVTGLLSSAVVVLEGVQHLFQYHADWLRYRSTSEALKRERHLFLAEAGPYARSDQWTLLAERLEDITARESAGWVDERARATTQ